MQFDSRYSTKEFYWGLEPHHLVINAIPYLPPHAKILDLGCGEGKDSFFLAKNDFDVTAVDFSEVGIKKLTEYSIKENLKIQTQVSNIQSYIEDCGDFDAVLAMNALQFLKKDTVTTVIEKIQSKTKPRGLHVIASFVAEDFEQKKLVAAEGGYYFDEGELRSLYKDWSILFYEEKLGDWETHGEPEHRHYTVKLIAQKK